MALRKLKPFTFRAKGLSDTLDGTNAFPGAMQQLVNLVQAPGSDGVYICRAASIKQTDFADFSTPGTITLVGVQGTRVYGMIGSARFPGHDEPFCFDMATQTFITVHGVTSANTPLTPPSAGDWNPPTIDAVTNSRIVVTHPGFTGINDIYFGWFDVSSFSIGTLKGNTANGSPIIHSINDGATSAPIIDGVQPGMTINGTNIPAGTTVKSVSNGTFDLATTGDTHTNTTLDNLASTVGVLIGMAVTGPQFAAGTYVAAIVSSTEVTLSAAALGTASTVAVNFSGGGTITMSANATGTADSTALTIAGGTPSAPLWGAGNTNVNPLNAVPVAVTGFNGRAWYAVGNAIVGSDSLNPCNVSNADQALILGDGEDVTALVGLPLTSQVTGGVLQSLIAFKGAQPFFQITGDFTTSIVVNLVNGSVGTEAPLTICATPLGIAFVAPDGLRILGLSGTVSEPIGVFGKGVALPFINALYPSRMAAAYNQNTIRISGQNGQVAGQPFQEYWLNLESKQWTGPHTFPASHIASYTAGNQVGFVLAASGIDAALWFHTAVPQLSSTYVENDMNLSWSWVSSLLPDNGMMAMNSMVETTMMLILVQGESINFAMIDETGSQIAQLTLNGTAPAGVVGTWGTSVWGQFTWGGVLGSLKQYRIPWTSQVVFKQAFFTAAGTSQANFAIGNLYMGLQPLGYVLEDFILAEPPADDFLEIDVNGDLLNIDANNPDDHLIIGHPA